MYGCSALAAARAPFVALAVGLLWSPAVAVSATKHTAPSPKQPFAYNTSGDVSVAADPASVSGPAVLQFQGVTGASFDPRSGQVLNLGQFVAAPSSVASGQATTFNGTPFEVEVQAPEFNKTSSVPVLDKIFPTYGKKLNLKTVVENSLLLKGHLDGAVAANGQVNVTATVDSIKLGSMDVQTQDHATHYAFPIRYSQLKLPSSWVMGGTSITTPALTPTTTPAVTTTPSGPVAQAQLITPSPVNAIMATNSRIAPIPAAESFAVATAPTPTPEPSTILLFATAFGGLAVARRRRKSR